MRLLSNAANRLAKAIAPGPQVSAGTGAPPPLRHTRGVVHTTSPLTIYVDGNSTVAIPSSAPAWATLTIGQTVEILLSDGRCVVIG